MPAATLTIDLAALVANWRLLADKVGAAKCFAVVKADAYGLGMVPVAAALVKAGCQTFFVAHLSEAVALRALAPDAIIYVLNGLPPGNISKFAAHDLRPVLGDNVSLAEWIHHAGDKAYAMQVDTGMNRLGIKPQHFGELTACDPTLIMSHFISSEIHDDPRNRDQIAAFDAARALFPNAKASMANSSGIFLKEMPFYDLVRPGYALYGGNPTPGAPNPMRNVVSLHAPAIQVADVPQGETVGYNGIWTAPRDSVVATLPLGYADGFLRSGSNEAQVAWQGKLCPLIGRISMDLVTIDVTDALQKPRRGDILEVIGDALPIDAVATRLKTIGYEVLTSLGKRYQRRYI